MEDNSIDLISLDKPEEGVEADLPPRPSLKKSGSVRQVRIAEQVVQPQPL